MEFLIISENKIKIMLNEAEVKNYGIESEKSDYSDPEIRRAFWKILDRARDESGFKVSGEKLLIQYYPSKNGAEIFVTKLGKISVGTERTIGSADSVAMLTSKNMIYRFEDKEPLLRLSKEVVVSGASTLSDVYFCEDGCYYLFFEERCDLYSLSPFSVASEFGDEVPRTMELYIKEHSVPVALGDAFFRLGTESQ